MKTLIIGYGNTLRGDDGVGFRIAEAVEAWNLEGVEARPCQQLTPELAAAMAEAKCVIFVDATPPQNPPSPIVVEQVGRAVHSSLFSAHHSSPSALLALTQQLYGKQPKTYTLLLPSWSMGYSEELSPIAQQGFNQGLRRLSELLTTLSID